MSFFVACKRRKGGERNRMAKEYDIDGCYCLLLAIEDGLGASSAYTLYQHGPKKLKESSFLARGRPPDIGRPTDRAEQETRIRELRKQGYTLEKISELLGRDSSTVKRNLKRMEEMKE